MIRYEMRPTKAGFFGVWKIDGIREPYCVVELASARAAAKAVVDLNKRTEESVKADKKRRRSHH